MSLDTETKKNINQLLQFSMKAHAQYNNNHNNNNNNGNHYKKRKYDNELRKEFPGLNNIKEVKQRKKCTHCGKNGHDKDMCWDLHPEKKRDYYEKRKEEKPEGFKIGENARRLK